MWSIEAYFGYGKTAFVLFSNFIMMIVNNTFLQVFCATYLLTRPDTIFDLIYFIQKTARINQSSEIILKVTSVDHFQTNGNSKTLFRAHHECE